MERQASTTRIYNRILEYEGRLDSLHFELGASMRAGDHRRVPWLESRYHLRAAHEELVLLDPEFMSKSQLLLPFWMRLYYTPVEQARTFLSRQSNQAHEEEVLKRDVLTIIDEGVGFFTILIYRLKTLSSIKSNQSSSFQPKVRERTNKYQQQQQQQQLSSEALNYLTYDSLIYLGDLIRYKVSFKVENVKSGSLELSSGYYREAARLLPAYGHAYNQLAVLSCLQDDVLAGISYYLRATMAVNSFPKAADNLLTLCRRVVNVGEERLALAKDPITAALFGLLVRLCGAVIVHEMCRTAQSVHLESITAGLAKLLSLPNDGPLAMISNKEEENTLVTIVATIIFSVEFLQQQLSTSLKEKSAPYLSNSQLRLVEWLFIICDKILRRIIFSDGPATAIIGFATVSLVNAWILETDIISRISNTIRDPQSTFEKAYKNILRTFAEVVNKLDCTDKGKEKFVGILDEDRILVGIQTFAGIKDTRASTTAADPRFRLQRIYQVVQFLMQNSTLLVYDTELDTYYFRDDFEKMVKRELISSRLARQRLADQVCTLQNNFNDTELDQSEASHMSWHIFDAESLITYWEQIEPLLPRLRLIITLAALRYLDYVKSESSRMVIARKIMRCIAAQSRLTESSFHLQHPRETANIQDLNGNNLAKHHRAVLTAVKYYADNPNGFAPIVVLTEDPVLREALETFDVDCIHDIRAYLSSYLFK